MKMKKLLFILIIFVSSPVAYAISDDRCYEYVETSLTDDDSFTLLTNPVKDGMLQIRFDKLSKPNVTISIINSLGNQVYSKQTNVSAQLLDLDISRLASGIYFIRVNTSSSNLVKKLIIQ